MKIAHLSFRITHSHKKAERELTHLCVFSTWVRHFFSVS